MPRKTYTFPKPQTLSTYEELRNLKLAVAVRAEQVKLRRLEWDTQKIALPHITPLPGDSELQIRKPMTKDDLPAPRPPAKPPVIDPNVPIEYYKPLIDLYTQQLQDDWDRNPYNWLASISAQEKKDARETSWRRKLDLALRKKVIHFIKFVMSALLEKADIRKH